MRTEGLKIAVQKSGRLSEATLDVLKRCGLRIQPSKNKLITHVKNMPIDILFVRDDDIPALIMEGVVDLGFVGDNIMEEVRLAHTRLGKSAEFTRLASLDYGHCRLAMAIPQERPYEGVQDLEGLRIATSYPHSLKTFLDQQQVQAQVVHLTGSVEVAPRAGLAEAICDLVSTGITLEANGLREVDVILRSSATLVQRPGSMEPSKQALVDRLLIRVQGVMQAKESKYIMLHAPADKVSDIIAVLPGAEQPTVIPLAESRDQVAIHAVSKEAVFWETMESIQALGGSSILVLPIEKMLG